MSYFDAIPPVLFKGPETEDPLAYRFYDKARVLRGKTMEEHLRIAVCYWHTFAATGADPFGSPTLDRPWFNGSPVAAAESKLRNAFDFMSRLGTPFFTFHDRDVAPECGSWRETNLAFDRIAEQIEQAIARTGVRLLWGTANLFSHPRYMAGAATNPDPEVFACAAAQVKKAMDVTHRLGGANYVLWGGREGYETLLNTNLKQELDQLARFLHLVVEHKHKIGFNGTLLIEPKPHEPTKHQYDFDTATVYAFLQHHGLEKELRLNIEANHAQLAGHTFHHEVAYAFAHGIFGSIDANRGDPSLGWDTDQMPNDPLEIGLVIAEILRGGGFTTGGFNFDAKVRRQSTTPEDLFHAHIGGIDTLARGLLAADKMLTDGKLDALVSARYAGWQGELGQEIMKRASLDGLASMVLERNLEPKPRSGQQERYENLLSRY